MNNGGAKLTLGLGCMAGLAQNLTLGEFGQPPGYTPRPDLVVNFQFSINMVNLKILAGSAIPARPVLA
jgi:hypothetical protein